MEKYEEFKQALCADLDGFREAKGFTKLDLAKLSKKCPSYIVSLTKGYTSPTVRTLFEVAEAMDAEVKIEFRSK